jgi:hypothetical protein
MNTSLLYIIALTVAFPIAGFFIKWVLSILCDSFKIPKGPEWLFFWLGQIERVIFFYAAYIGAWEVIGGWFVLKALAKFQNESSEEENIKCFYMFLIGNGLSLIFGAGSAIILQKLI